MATASPHQPHGLALPHRPLSGGTRPRYGIGLYVYPTYLYPLYLAAGSPGYERAAMTGTETVSSSRARRVLAAPIAGRDDDEGRSALHAERWGSSFCPPGGWWMTSVHQRLGLRWELSLWPQIFRAAIGLMTAMIPMQQRGARHAAARAGEKNASALSISPAISAARLQLAGLYTTIPNNRARPPSCPAA